jgi:ABC-2 type transport system ATP-binding protein
MKELAIEAIGLEKAFGATRVLEGIDLQVERGTLFSLLGPNGAGKTTTVRILATLTPADAGTVRVAGFDVRRDRGRVRRIISLTGQYVALDDLQTGEENLQMVAQLTGLSQKAARARARDLLDRFDLADHARRRVSAYSGGMRRRLDLAASLVGQPEIVFLDEPTTGLDVRSRQTMWEVITGLVAGGVTVFLTTQYLEEADRLADRVAVLDRGVVVAEGTPAQLKRRVGGQRLDLTASGPEALARMTGVLGSRAVEVDPGALTIGTATDGSAHGVRALLDEVDPLRGDVRTFAVHSVTMDDVFLSLTGTVPESKERETADV